MITTTIDLILIRHGETNWNVERRLQGHIDIPLNDTGLVQARALASSLQEEHLDAIICSDLKRAVQTAEAIAQAKKMRCQIYPEWRERNFGGFEGELVSTLSERFPVDYADWRAHKIDSAFPPKANGESTGESIRQVQARVEAALLNLCHHFSGKKIVVVTHGGILECAYRLAHQLPLNAPRQTTVQNASINRFELRATQSQCTLTLVQWGNVTHLSYALDDVAI